MEQLLRRQLVNLLKVGHAHMSFFDAVKEFPMDKINDRAPNVEYSFYDLLEHLRRTQADIVEYIVSSDYKDKKWPDDYWPEKNKTAISSDWNTSVDEFRKDLNTLLTIVEEQDLERTLPNNETVLRELLVVIDHNAYHVGEFAILRQVTNTWTYNHE